MLCYIFFFKPIEALHNGAMRTFLFLFFQPSFLFFQGRYNNSTANKVLLDEPFTSEIFEYAPDLIETAKGEED